MRKAVDMEECIVTGGAGVDRQSSNRGAERARIDNILVVDHLNHPAKERNLATLAYRRYLDRDAFRAALRAGQVAPARTLFHLGACSSTTETDQAYLDDNNTGTTRELCAWCLANGTRFIYASSAANYGDGELGYSDDDAVNAAPENLESVRWSKQKFDLIALRKAAGPHRGTQYFNVSALEGNKGRALRDTKHHQIRETGSFALFPFFIGRIH